jgi:hypothetical protein
MALVDYALPWSRKGFSAIFGTWFFLASIITTLPLAPDSPAKDRCLLFPVQRHFSTLPGRIKCLSAYRVLLSLKFL